MSMMALSPAADTHEETFSTKREKISCYVKKILMIWPDPSFFKKTTYVSYLLCLMIKESC